MRKSGTVFSDGPLLYTSLFGPTYLMVLLRKPNPQMPKKTVAQVDFSPSRRQPKWTVAQETFAQVASPSRPLPKETLAQVRLLP